MEIRPKSKRNHSNTSFLTHVPNSSDEFQIKTRIYVRPHGRLQIIFGAICPHNSEPNRRNILIRFILRIWICLKCGCTVAQRFHFLNLFPAESHTTVTFDYWDLFCNMFTLYKHKEQIQTITAQQINSLLQITTNFISIGAQFNLFFLWHSGKCWILS